MGTKQAFKTYARTQRIQDTNLSFAKGMNFTDAPLVEGFSRLLVNLDFGSDGNTLKPRKGLVKESTLAVQGISWRGVIINDFNRIIRDGKTYYQIIVSMPDSDASLQYGSMNLGYAWVITALETGTPENPEIEYLGHTALWDFATSTHCMFMPTTSSIHGITVTGASPTQKHIGSFAFNGAYYYFTTDGKLHYTYFDEDWGKYMVATITPFSPLQYETQNGLYNMLLTSYTGGDPYVFTCNIGGSLLTLTGFMPGTGDDEDWRLVLTPQKGIEYTYKLWYTYPEKDKKYHLHIEYTPGDDTWYTVPRDESEIFIANGEPFIVKHIKVDYPAAQFRIYALPAEKASFPEGAKEGDTQFTLDMLAHSVVLPVAFNYTSTDKEKSTTNLGVVRYNLSYAKGITYWKNRLWVFGAAEVNEEGTFQRQENMVLFASGPNRPDWFPYPAFADIFDEEIMYLQPMLDELLVFTAHNLYSLSLDAEGWSWTKKHLQGNLNINPWDYNLIQVVKNMVFFKSGNYYYMVVPKLTAASGSGLAIAPISKNITGFLDAFSDNVKQLVDDLFNYSCESRFKNKSKITHDLELVHYYNYLDYEDVHNNYVFRVTRKEKIGWSLNKGDYHYNSVDKYLTVSLLYNTVSRTWRIYTIESDGMLVPVLKDATGKGLYASAIGSMYDDRELLIQFLKFDNKSCADMFLRYSRSLTAGQESICETVDSAPLLFPNWQYLDSGNLDQNSDMKKRFREYQFKIMNETSNAIEFYSGFYLDKATRTYEMSYNQETFEDLESQEQVTVIDAVPATGMQGDPNKRVGATVLDEALYQYTKLGSWKLGVSVFPKTLSWKVRVPTSGKGYLPRIILISYNKTSYELLSCATVYRQLYSR